MTHLVDIAANLPLTARTERWSGRSRVAAPPSGCRPSWCVLATYPQAERRAHATLHLKGFEAYLPLLTVRWADRSYHTGPLFPGYLFVRLDLSRPWYPIRWCPGVFSLLAINGIPSICPAAVIEALRAGEAIRRTTTHPEALWRPGAACEAVLGGGQTVEGVVVSVSRRKARVAAIMFGAVRQMVVSLANLRQRRETA